MHHRAGSWDAQDQLATTEVVDCAQPHQVEAVGVALLDMTGPYPGDDALNDACEPVATGYAGTSSSFSYGAWNFKEASWNTGRRWVDCVIGVAGDVQGWGTRTGSMRR